MFISKTLDNYFIIKRSEYELSSDEVTIFNSVEEIEIAIQKLKETEKYTSFAIIDMTKLKEIKTVL